MLVIKRATMEANVSLTYTHALLSKAKFTYFAIFHETEPGIRAFLDSFDTPVLLFSLDRDDRVKCALIEEHFKDQKGMLYVAPLLALESAFALPSSMLESLAPKKGVNKKTHLFKRIKAKDVYLYRKGSVHDTTLPMKVFTPTEYLTGMSYRTISGELMNYVVTYETFCRHLYKSKVVCEHEYAARKRRSRSSSSRTH